MRYGQCQTYGKRSVWERAWEYLTVPEEEQRQKEINEIEIPGKGYL